MAPKRNGVIPNVHFHKHWQNYIRLWFSQPARKKRRRVARIAKARRIAPRPLGMLRPVVRCGSVRYNRRVRLGKGFTFEELKAAGINKRFAPTIGVAVDFRRRNKSVESLQENVQRLKEYKSRLILYPRNSKKLKPGESTPEEIKMAKQLKGKVVMPLKKPEAKFEARPITEREKKFCAWDALHNALLEEKTWGRRAKKAKEAAMDDAVLLGKK